MSIFSKENAKSLTIAGIMAAVIEWIEGVLKNEASKKVMDAINKKESLASLRQRALSYIYNSKREYPNLLNAFSKWQRRTERGYGKGVRYESGFEDKASNVLTIAFITFCNLVENRETGETGEIIISEDEKYKDLLRLLDEMGDEERDNTIKTLEYNWKAQALVRFLEGVDKPLHGLISFFLKPAREVLKKADKKRGYKQIKFF